ncbi:MAG: tRNA pseudouridine(38-40) synthase TruA [Bryobacterales bacterium]|nr:tRNA pseudouridine(38-40) synthase TruA [Bryobacterales bacterium]
MRRIRFTISYDGSAYFGWQIQPGLTTVQATLEGVLSRIEGAPVKIHGSGRTDAGVHALAQVAACDLRNPIPPANLQRALNRLLPRDIRILEVADVEPHFHPRYHAIAKTYRYRIHRQPVCPPFDRLYVWQHPYPLDEARMEAAASCFEGTHGFRAFTATDPRYTPGADMHRSIFRSHLARQGDLLVYEVRGSGFLKHMVRNLCGALVELGCGNLTEADLQQMLHTGTRHTGIRTLPSQGLFLVNVEYPDVLPVQPPSSPMLDDPPPHQE